MTAHNVSTLLFLPAVAGIMLMTGCAHFNPKALPLNDIPTQEKDGCIVGTKALTEADESDPARVAWRRRLPP